MPYSGPDDDKLPDNVKKMGKKKREQWVAVWNSAYKRCRDDGGDDCEAAAFVQANGVVARETEAAKYDGIDFTPPKGVQQAAARALKWRKEYGRGMTDTGVARARDLSNGRTVSPETARRMNSFFARHGVNHDEHYKLEDGEPTTWRIAWDGWGGDAGRSWIRRIISQMDKADERAKEAEAPSLNALLERVGKQWRIDHGGDDMSWVREVFLDHMVAEMEDGTLMAYPYEIKDGEMVWGEPYEVEMVYQEVQEAIQNVGSIAPRVTEGETFDGREWEITIIGPTKDRPIVTVDDVDYIVSGNGLLYAVEAVAASVDMWKGAKVYDNHLTEEEYRERGGMRSVAREWVGSIANPKWSKARRALEGTLKIVDEALARKLKAAHDAGVLDTIGLSIDTLIERGAEATYEGRPHRTAVGFSKILSVDIVAEPAAGGGFNRLVEARNLDGTPKYRKKENETMKLTEELKEQIGQIAATAMTEALPGAVAEALAAKKQAEAEEPPEEEKPTEPEGEPEEESKAAKEAEALNKRLDEMEQKARKMECTNLLKEKLDASNLSQPMRDLVRGSFAGRVFEAEDLDAEIKRVSEAQAKLDPSGRVTETGNGDVSMGMAERDWQEVALLRLLMGNNAFRQLEHAESHYVTERIPESYNAWVKGGRKMDSTRRVSEWLYEICGGDPWTRAYEAETTSTLTSIVKNAVNVMLANDYSKRDEWWAELVNEEEVDTIDQATLVRVYGIDTLSVVDEGQAYDELDWEDEEETASFVKKGGYVGITLETMLSDKLNVIRTIPQRLANSWYNTLSALVAGVFTVNSNTGPVLADTGALFNSTAVSSTGGHANLLTTGLSFTAFGAARTAMMKQTDRTSGNGRKLMIEPRFLLVPVDLETTANQIRNSEMLPGSANNDVNPYYQQFDIVKVPDWTDANDWALAGDPTRFPAIHLVFLRGRRVPELFTADSETGGAMFTNDTMRFKVRLMTWRFSSTYDCAPVSDFRPLHKNNVS